MPGAEARARNLSFSSIALEKIEEFNSIWILYEKLCRKYNNVKEIELLKQAASSKYRKITWSK